MCAIAIESPSRVGLRSRARALRRLVSSMALALCLAACARDAAIADAGTPNLPSGPGLDPCPFTSCLECVQSAGCGFCSRVDGGNDAAGRCMPGGPAGSRLEPCPGRWLYGGSACGDPCAGYGDCGVCTASTRECGWCAATNGCRPGTADGPDSPPACADWRYYEAACASPDPCGARVGCADCTGAAGCGFCASTGRCLSGTSAAPAAGACADWRFTSARCGDGG